MRVIDIGSTSNLSVEEITSLYLYGEQQPPENYNDRIREEHPESIRLLLNAVDYMQSGPGRFATAALAPFLNTFFENDTTGLTGVKTVADLKALGISADQFRFSFNQVGLDPLSSDYAARTYISGSTAFQLSDLTTFDFDHHTMSNVVVRPFDDNFDFDSSNGYSQLGNLILKPAIDPYDLGRGPVELKFTDESKDAISAIPTYTKENFESDYFAFYGAAYNPAIYLATAGVVMAGVINDLIDTHTIEYEKDGRAIVYGSFGDDDLQAPNVLNVRGGIVAGGPGMDTIHGSLGDDDLYGGKGDDVFLNDIDDAKTDHLYGGVGWDEYNVGSGTTFDGWQFSHTVTDTGGRSGTFNSNIYSFIDIISDDDGLGSITYHIHGLEDGELELRPMTIPEGAFFEHDSNLYGGLQNWSGGSVGLDGQDPWGPIWVVYDESTDRLLFYDPEVGVAAFAIEGFVNGDFGITIEGFQGPNDSVGTDGDNVLQDSPGRGSISGGLGSDTYVYHPGDGNDNIVEASSATDIDVLNLVDISSSDVRFGFDQQSDDLITKVISTGETIRIAGQFAGDGVGVEQIEFNGQNAVGANDPGPMWIFGVGTAVELTDDDITTVAGVDGLTGSDIVFYSDENAVTADLELKQFTVASVGTVDIENIEGLGGGIGNDVLKGDSQSNYLGGDLGDDILIGRQGDDRLFGDDGNDTYQYSRGDGSDRIVESGSANDIDTLELADLNSQDVFLSRNADDLLVKVSSTGEVITIADHFVGSDSGIEFIHFVDNTSWDRDDIENNLSVPVNHAPQVTEDIEVARTGLNTVAVGALLGGSDQDGDAITFQLVAGSQIGGSVEIDPDAGTFEFTPTTNFSGYASFQYVLNDGSLDSEAKLVTVHVDAVNSAPTGASLNTNTVAENAANGTVIGTVTGVDPDAGDSLSYALFDDADGRFAINATTGVITVADGTQLDYETATSHGITVRVTDHDGLNFDKNFTIGVIDMPDIITGTSTRDNLQGTSGDDSIYAYEGADVVHAGLGNDLINGGSGGDVLYGEGGDDLFIAGQGGGNDTIYGGDGVDTVSYAESAFGVTTFSAPVGHSYLLMGYGSNLDRLEDVENIVGSNFDDGIAGTDSNNSLMGGAGNDVLTGGAGNDILEGGTGSDTLTGGSGADDFVFRANFGHDIITDFNGSEGDILTFVAPLSSWSATQVGDDTVITFDESNSITLQGINVASMSPDWFDYTGDNINHAPTDASLNTSTVAENASNGTVIGTVTGIDPDAGGSLSYALFDDADGRFAINGTTGVITVADGTQLDYETATSHGITVRVTDQGGLTFDKDFTIGVTNVNEAPSDASLNTSTVAENASNGTVIGTVTGIDPDAGGSLSYALFDDADGRFAINGTTGVITVADGTQLDYETATSHGITVRVTDQGGLTFDKDFTIGVTNVNEAPSDASLNTSTVAENAANGTVVGTVTGVDPDAGGSLSYALFDDADGRFAINGTTGVITVADGTQLDYETATSHGITVRVTDQGGLTFDKDFTIGVTNVNEAPSDASLNTSTVAENAANGTVVGTVTGVDPDAGGSLSYALFDDADGRFAINGTTGVITVADGTQLDYETATSHGITVRVTDQGGLTFDKDFTIGVMNVNEAPSDASLNTSTVAENASNGTVIGTVTGIDPDAGGSLSYALFDDADGRFAINGTTGVITVADGTQLDYETATSHGITVRVTDQGGLTFDKDFTIGVTNVNEAPSDASLNTSTVAENAANGTVVGTVTGVDPDAGGSLSYALFDDADGRFAINGTTGVITVADGTQLDYETATSHGITVRVTDQGGLTFDKDFTIGVTNVNEAPSDASLNTSTVAENAANGTVVGTVTGVDPDAGGSLSYALFDDADGRFAINGTTGVITVADGTQLDYETATSHGITVRVTDQGGLTFDKDFTIGVMNVNEAPSDASLNTSTVAENASNGTVIGTVTGIDPDAGGSLSYALFDDADGRFAINGTTGVITVADGTQLDYETATSHGITVRVTDQGGLTFDKDFTIGVTNVSGITVSGTSGNDTIYGTPENDTLSGGAGNDTIYGLGGNDILNGGLGDDWLDGGTGNDTMTGGGGWDMYVVDSLGDVVIGAGSGAVYSALSNYTLPNNVLEFFYLGGATPLTLTGNSLNNILRGGSGNDIIDGGAGNDTLVGGAGNDIYYVNSQNDLIQEDANAGTDEVRTALSNYDLRNGPVENLTYVGSGNFTATGNTSDNVITGGAGADNLSGDTGNDTLLGGAGNDTLNGGNGSDWIDGGAGADIMTGGTGWDMYVVDNVGDVVLSSTTVEGAVYSALSTYVLPGRIAEFFYWGGATPLTLTGNNYNNVLRGGSGNDIIDGGSGNDQMIGYAGDDIYKIDTLNDTVVENSNEGIDEVRTALATYSLMANVEKLTYTGAANFSGTGNELDNTITGGNYNDTLHGGDGADFLVGGAGSDTADYSGNASAWASLENSSTNLYSAAGDTYSGIENLTGGNWSNSLTGDANVNILTGGGDVDYLYGRGGNDTLLGNSGNDWLDGGAGADVLNGGPGSDYAWYGSSTTGVNVSIASHTATGGDAQGDTFTSIENVYGSSFNDTIEGDSGNNILNGGDGIDTVSYASATSGVNVNISVTTGQNTGGAGTDTLSNFENLTGSSSGDILGGTEGNNIINGGGGSDYIMPGGGDDTITGGAGSDTFAFWSGWIGHDTITDFTTADVIELHGGTISNFAAIQAVSTQVGSDVQITLDSSNSILLKNVALTNLTHDEFHFMS